MTDPVARYHEYAALISHSAACIQVANITGLTPREVAAMVG